MLWKLSVSGNRFVGLRPHDLTYFGRNFIGEPLKTPWKPPPVELLRLSKRLPDFVHWAGTVPVVSQKALDALHPLLRSFVQVLPFHDLKGKKYYAVNVLAVVDGLVDQAQSNISRAASDASIIEIHRTVFRQSVPSGLPPMFKLAEGWGGIFVSSKLAELAVENQLTGVQFLAPTQDTIRLALGKEPLNAYPGTPPIST